MFPTSLKRNMRATAHVYKMASTAKLVFYCLKETKALLERQQVCFNKACINEPRMARLNKFLRDR